MVDRLSVRWKKIPTIYKIILFALITLCTIGTPSLFVPLLMFLIIYIFTYLIFEKFKDRTENEDDIEDDPTGNSNVKKKFYEYM